MIKCAIYARFSSNNQQEDSIEAQIKACKKYAKDNNMSIVETYIDRAKSATNDNRPSFQKMIQDSNHGVFNTVIVHKLDRFSRNRYDKSHYKRILKLNGVSIRSVLENIDDSPESIMMESIIDGMNEYYSANLAREVRKVMHHNAEKAKHNGGIPPLGLDVDIETMEYIINKEEAIIVKEIFEMYSNGLGYKKIVKRLNRKGYKTKLGNSFSTNSISSILRNEKYTGTYVYNRAQSKSVDGKRNNWKSKSEDEIIRVPNAFPAIVSEQLFTEVQDGIKSNSRNRQSGQYKSKETYLLSGLVECGVCGYAMTGNRRFAGRNKTKYVTHRCNNRFRKGSVGCGNKEIRKDYLEEFVLKELVEKIFSPKNIPILIDELITYQANKESSVLNKIKLLESKIREAEKTINNLLKAIEQGIISKSITTQLNQREDEKIELEYELDKVKASTMQQEINEEMILNIVNHFKANLSKNNTVEVKKFVQAFVKKVIVKEDHIIVVFTFNPIVDLSGGGGGTCYP